MHPLAPPPLCPDDTIALIAPSSHCDKDAIIQTKAELEKLGYQVAPHDQCYARRNMFSGTPEEKAHALQDVFADPAINAIFCMRGGYGAIDMLDKIDYAVIQNNPKIFMGYSDITALHAAIHAKTGLITFHGPIARNFAAFGDKSKIMQHQTNDAALGFLSGEIPENLFHDHPVNTLRQGQAAGKLWGGNLSLMSVLIQAGEAYHPPFKEAILVIEDIGEEITALDRLLGSWRLRGIFKDLAGLVVGHMTDVKDTEGSAGYFVDNINDVLLRHTKDLNGPIVTNAPFGHDLPNHVFPFGCKAKLQTGESGSRLSLLEKPFAR